MGYNVNIMRSTCKLPLTNAAEAYKRICDLNQRNDLKHGGGHGPGIDRKALDAKGPHPDIWFSWMEWNYPETCKDAQDILNALGFETELTDTDILITGYDSKIGSEEDFFKAIGDLLVGAIAWHGEDGMVWGWKFDGGMKMVEPRTI